MNYPMKLVWTDQLKQHLTHLIIWSGVHNPWCWELKFFSQVWINSFSTIFSHFIPQSSFKANASLQWISLGIYCLSSSNNHIGSAIIKWTLHIIDFHAWIKQYGFKNYCEIVLPTKNHHRYLRVGYISCGNKWFTHNLLGFLLQRYPENDILFWMNLKFTHPKLKSWLLYLGSVILWETSHISFIQIWWYSRAENLLIARHNQKCSLGDREWGTMQMISCS